MVAKGHTENRGGQNRGGWIIGMDANAEPPALGDEVCGYIGIDPTEAYEAYSDVHEALKGWGGHGSRPRIMGTIAPAKGKRPLVVGVRRDVSTQLR